MKVAIFSDVHDNIERWQQAANIIKEKNIEVAICCGDITKTETVNIISKSFKILYLVFGNADYALKNSINLFNENIKFFERLGKAEIDNKKIAFIHNRKDICDEDLVDKPDVIFFGHTHTPWEEIKEKVKYINPGEICGREGIPTFAIFDTKKMSAELIILK